MGMGVDPNFACRRGELRLKFSTVLRSVVELVDAVLFGRGLPNAS